jgi:DNA helicase TIP49 (TBP-interacting protein)
MHNLDLLKRNLSSSVREAQNVLNAAMMLQQEVASGSINSTDVERLQDALVMVTNAFRLLEKAQEAIR